MNKYYIVIIIAAIFTVIAQMLLKYSASKNKGKSVVKTYFNIFVFLGYTIFVVVTVLNLFALKEVPLLFMVIVNAIIQVFVVLSSVVFFNEKINTKQILGLALIVIGVVVFNTF